MEIHRKLSNGSDTVCMERVKSMRDAHGLGRRCMPQNSHFSRLARAAARRSSRARDMRNEIMKFNLTSVYIVISRSKIDVNQLHIVIITDIAFSKELVSSGGFCSRKLELSTTSAFFSCGGSKPVNSHFPSCFLNDSFNKSSTLYDIRNSFLSLSTEWG